MSSRPFVPFHGVRQGVQLRMMLPSRKRGDRQSLRSAAANLVGKLLATNGQTSLGLATPSVYGAQPQQVQVTASSAMASVAAEAAALPASASTAAASGAWHAGPAAPAPMQPSAAAAVSALQPTPTAAAAADTGTVLAFSTATGLPAQPAAAQPQGSNSPPPAETYSAAAPVPAARPGALDTVATSSTGGGSSAAARISVLEYVVQEMMEHLAKDHGQAPPRNIVMELLCADNLVLLPNTYIWLNDRLRRMKVRTVLSPADKRDQNRGISYVDIRCPADIKHPDRRAAVSSMTSSAQYLRDKGYELQHPQLPCVAFKVKAIGQQHGEGAPYVPRAPEHYVTYPLECCWVDTADMKKTTGDEDWEWQEVPDTYGDMHKGRMPRWIADVIAQHNRNPTAIADAQEVSSAAVPQAPPAAQAPVQYASAAAGTSSGLQPPAAAGMNRDAGHTLRSSLAAGQAISPPPAAQAAATAAGPTPHPGVVSGASGAGDAAAVSPGVDGSNAIEELLKLMPAASGDSSSDMLEDSSSSRRSASLGDRGTLGPCSSNPTFSQQPFHSINNGFRAWLGVIHPTEDEQEYMKSTIEAVQNALHAAAKGQLWSVAGVHPVGSFKKKTSLRGAHDLDLLLEINVDNCARGSFDTSRDACMEAIYNLLCRGPSHSQPDEHDPSSGWLLVSHSAHWMRLFHPGLQLELDVQVCQSQQHWVDNKIEARKQVLKHMISRAERKHGCRASPEPPAELPAGTEPMLTSPDEPSRVRTALMTPLLTDVVTGVPAQCMKQYGWQSDKLLTDVIRAVKAWSKHGLPHALSARWQCSCEVGSAAAGLTTPGSSSDVTPPHDSAAVMAATASAQGYPQGQHDFIKQPPSYIWEIFVIYVLLQKLQQGQAEGKSAELLYPAGTRELRLFMDVLEAASRLLLPTSSEPIAVYTLYTPEQCELFRGVWGPVSPLYCPFIIHPADPTYNCTKFSPFKQWEGVASAAGKLHQKMQALLQEPGLPTSDAGAAGAAAAQQLAGSSASGDAWQQLLSSSTLGPAVRAFPAQQS